MTVRRIAALLTTLAAALAVAGPASAGPLDPVPQPDDDPFYAVPAGISGLKNGTVLRSRQIEAKAMVVPMPAKSWQVLYKTTDNQSKATATVATVMVPTVPWTGPGRRPLLSYQTAEDGVGTKCAPSYALRAGAQAGTTNSSPETLLMLNALLRGWAVVAPDYEGPHSQFLGAPGEAHGVLDGVRAALRFGPAGIHDRTRVGLWGYSGGAFASSVAAQTQPRYAPELNVAGVALGGVPADIRSTLDAFNGSAVGGAIVIGVIGLDRSYPKAKLASLANAEGRKRMQQSQTDCINDAVVKHPFLRIESMLKDPNALNLPHVKRLLLANSPRTYPGTPKAPVYGYHSVNDQLAPIGPARGLYDRFCAAGTKVQRHEDVASEHIALIATGATAAMQYLGDRFAGKPAPDDC